jgi:CHAD domain-containing protein
MLSVLPAGRNLLPCDESSRAFLAAALVRQVQSMRLEVPGVCQAEDMECIHRMRVASRRARNLLPLIAGCIAQKRLQTWSSQLRGITRALGAARDTDVQIELLAGFESSLLEPRAHLGIRRLLLRLRQQRAGLQAKLLRALQQLEEGQALEKIEEVLTPLALPTPEAGAPSTHQLYQRTAHFVQRCLDDFLAYETFIFNPANITQLHAMRISAKHLRYTLETFAPLYSDGLEEEIRAVRKVQEYLGEVHDCDVWADFLPRFIAEERERSRVYYGHLRVFSSFLPGLNLFAQERAARRVAVYREFIQRWQKWARQPAKKGQPPRNFWQDLRARIRQPLLPSQIYPPHFSALVEAPPLQPDKADAGLDGLGLLPSTAVEDGPDA